MKDGTVNITLREKDMEELDAECRLMAAETGRRLRRMILELQREHGSRGGDAAWAEEQIRVFQGAIDSLEGTSLASQPLSLDFVPWDRD